MSTGLASAISLIFAQFGLTVSPQLVQFLMILLTLYFFYKTTNKLGEYVFLLIVVLLALGLLLL